MNSTMRANARLYYKILQAQQAVSAESLATITALCNKKFGSATLEPAKLIELKKYIQLATERAQAIQLYLNRLEATIYVENPHEYRDIIKDIQEELSQCMHEGKSIHTLCKPIQSLPEALHKPLLELKDAFTKHVPVYVEALRQLEKTCL